MKTREMGGTPPRGGVWTLAFGPARTPRGEGAPEVTWQSSTHGSTACVCVWLLGGARPPARLGEGCLQMPLVG